MTSWQTYNAKRGERMDNIADKFGINVSELRNVNGLSASKKVRNSQAMLVPAVYKGEPISDAFEIQSDTINATEMENNNAILEADEIEPKASRNITHKVKKGETLQALANKYDTNTRALIKNNSLKSTQLKAGQTLRIKDAEATNTKLKSTGNNKVRREVVNEASSKKISSHANKIKSKRKISAHISARSHIRLK